jgi:hypothetical protein
MSDNEWNDAEYGALKSFISSPGVLRNALEKYTAQLADEHRAQCASFMSSVPRDTEQASDHAAKAQALDEFWALLFDILAHEQRELPPTQVL